MVVIVMVVMVRAMGPFCRSEHSRGRYFRLGFQWCNRAPSFACGNFASSGTCLSLSTVPHSLRHSSPNRGGSTAGKLDFALGLCRHAVAGCGTISPEADGS